MAFQGVVQQFRTTLDIACHSFRNLKAETSLMGCICIKQPQDNHEGQALLAAETHFNEADVEALQELFRKLSSSVTNDGVICREEFQLGMFRNSKKRSLFTDRLFQLFDLKQDGAIEFDEFVRSLSIFHPKATQAEKIAFAFQLYDIWQTGFIEREEVKELILALLEESDLVLSDDIIEAIINKTFDDADSKKDGKIDPEEWNECVTRNPSLLKNMTIPYLRDITSSFPSFTMIPDKEDDKK